MWSSSDTIRQAALVLANLDRDARDAVLEEMPADQAEKIRDMLLHLDAEDATEQELAIRKFLSAQRHFASDGHPAHACDRTADEFDLGGDDAADGIPQPIPDSPRMDQLTSSIRDLLQNSDRSLADVVRLERATTVAALLSAIPGFRAARILKRLPPEQRTKVLMILESGVQPHPKAIEVISEWICDHLATCSLEPAIGLRHRSALKAILDAFSPDEREAMLDDIAQQNPLLARRLATSSSSQVDELPDCYC